MTLADRTGVDAVAHLRAVIMRDAVHFGAGLRRSGEPYEWILDLRVLLLRAEVLDDICRALWAELRPHRPDAVIGVGMSGTVLVTGVLSVAWRDDGVRLRGAVVRSEPKHHGLAKTLEGDDVTGRRLGFVDDIVNSGQTLSIALRAAQHRAARIAAAAAIVSFDGAGEEVARRHRIPFARLLTTRDLGLAPLDAAGTASGPTSALAVRTAEGPHSARSDLLGYRNDGGTLRMWLAHGESAVTARTVAADGHALAAHFGEDLFVASHGRVQALGPGRTVQTRDSTWVHPWVIGEARPVAITAGPLAVIVVTEGDGDSDRGGGVVHVRPTGQRGRAWHRPLPPTDPAAMTTPTATEWMSARSVVIAAGQVLRCLHVDDGQDRWEYRVPAQVTAVQPAGTLCFVTDRAGWLVALTERGTPAWTARVESGRQHTILVTDSRVLVLTSRRTVAVSAAGEQRWIFGAGATSDRAVVGPDGVLVLVDGRHRNRVERIDLATGAHLDTVTAAVPVRSVHRSVRHVILRDDQDGFWSVPKTAGRHGDR